MSHCPPPHNHKKKPAQKLRLETRAELEHFRQKLQDLASQHPEKAAKILADWISRPAIKQTLKKKTG